MASILLGKETQILLLGKGGREGAKEEEGKKEERRWGGKGRKEEITQKLT